MTKEAYYFSHDANARQDPKILEMMSVYGAEGYGWYWILVEMMREQSDFTLNLKGKYTFNALAMQMHCNADASKKFVSDCIDEFHLFDSDGELFWSNSLLRRMAIKEELSMKRKKAAEKRWGSKENANCMQMHSKSNANGMQGKEKKVKERKEKENNYNTEFEEWWKLYPKKSDKQDSFKKFKKAREKHSYEMLLVGLKGYIKQIEQEGTEKRYIKNGATFLNKQSYLDFIEEEKPKVDPQEKLKQSTINRIKELEKELGHGLQYHQDMGTEDIYYRYTEELEELHERLRDLEKEN